MLKHSLFCFSSQTIPTYKKRLNQISITKGQCLRKHLKSIAIYRALDKLKHMLISVKFFVKILNVLIISTYTKSQLKKPQKFAKKELTKANYRLMLKLKNKTRFTSVHSIIVIDLCSLNAPKKVVFKLQQCRRRCRAY